ncbi:hypothetical protein V8C37DRAFT_115627 [Trichoderma ceciliae]
MFFIICIYIDIYIKVSYTFFFVSVVFLFIIFGCFMRDARCQLKLRAVIKLPPTMCFVVLYIILLSSRYTLTPCVVPTRSVPR